MDEGVVPGLEALDFRGALADMAFIPAASIAAFTAALAPDPSPFRSVGERWVR